MKKTIAIVLCMLFINSIYSQYTLSFCSAIDPASGYCLLNNTKFISSPDSAGALIFIKIENMRGLSTAKITYKVFKTDGKNETPFNSNEQKIEKEWTSSWRYDNFPSPGVYMVHVYDEANKEIASKSFELRRDW